MTRSPQRHHQQRSHHNSRSRFLSFSFKTFPIFSNRSKSRHRSSSDSGGGGSGSGEESHTLAIFNLYYRTDEDELRRIFERYGKIEVNNFFLTKGVIFSFFNFTDNSCKSNLNRNVTSSPIAAPGNAPHSAFSRLRAWPMRARQRRTHTTWRSMATCEFCLISFFLTSPSPVYALTFA